eukprot:12888412-Prorocentrum_lima.AAC.1
MDRPDYVWCLGPPLEEQPTHGPGWRQALFWRFPQIGTRFYSCGRGSFSICRSNTQEQKG